MKDFIVNQNVRFDGRPIFCQLTCDACRTTYCGAWRSDWISRLCRECRSGQVKPVIDYQICKTVFEPTGVRLN